MRLKHNKKRNTAFLYEALIRELTKSIIKQNKYRIKEITSIIKEGFASGTCLAKELKVYKSLYEGSMPNKELATRLVTESRAAYKEIDQKEIFTEQSKLISKINKLLSSDVYRNFVPNYKSIATVHSIFNVDLTPKDRVILESKIIDNLHQPSGTPRNQDMDHVDGIVYKTFVEKFNDKYVSLKESQKELLNKYITSISDNGLDFKIYLNEEVARLQGVVKNSYNNEEFKDDKGMKAKLQKVENLLESLKKTEIDGSLLKKTVKIQDLVEEIQNGS